MYEMAERLRTHLPFRSMAPFALYPPKTLEDLSRLSDTYNKRQELAAEIYDACNDGLALQDIDNDDIPSPINFMRRCMPLTPSVELYAPFRAMSTWGMNKSETGAALPSTEAIEQSALERHLKSPEVVGITLAFLSVVLGLVAMAVTRSQWYRQKQASSGQALARVFSRRKNPPELQVDPFCSQVDINPSSDSNPTLAEYSVPPEMESKKMSSDSAIELKRFAIDEEEENRETEKRQTIPAPEDFTDYMVQQESPECTPSLNVAPSEYEMAVSQESGSSQQTTVMDDLERFSNASSSKTSIVSMGELEEEEEEMEETGQVFRAQTQSMEIKRAVLVSFSHMTAMRHQ
ncbi:hypothetical protein BDN70DRAFT_36949 [Pholiota conissans]|uniref:Uncharacterized protein n=1 Tax=Pholiota conissans TaxID=109636 RepID=A0A9P6CSV5_9AGAR|nr:hypothetical protein BDN70DRAFT_36949 [Pholiota conissans]